METMPVHPTLPPRSFENALEFGRAAQGARLLQLAFHKPLQYVQDARLMPRLMVQLNKVIKRDRVNGRGERSLIHGDLGLLQGFDFCAGRPLLRTFHAPFTPLVNRTTGRCAVDIPSFIPVQEVVGRSRFTHIRLVATAAAIDFEREQFDSHTVQSDPLPLCSPVSLTLEPVLPPLAGRPMLLVLGVQLLQVVNGKSYLLGERGFQPVSIIHCSL